MFDFYGSAGGGNGLKPHSRRLGKRRSANRPRLGPRQLKSELSAEARDWREFYKLLREARPVTDGCARGSRLKKRDSEI